MNYKPVLSFSRSASATKSPALGEFTRSQSSPNVFRESPEIKTVDSAIEYKLADDIDLPLKSSFKSGNRNKEANSKPTIKFKDRILINHSSSLKDLDRGKLSSPGKDKGCLII